MQVNSLVQISGQNQHVSMQVTIWNTEAKSIDQSWNSCQLMLELGIDAYCVAWSSENWQVIRFKMFWLQCFWESFVAKVGQNSLLKKFQIFLHGE
jgi:hypothetical protein